LEAAQRVFFSKGYLKATMDEIALESEISKPTIYQYFKTKGHLYFSLMLPVIEDIGQQLGKIEKKLAKQKYVSGSALIQDFFRAWIHSYKVSPDTFRIIQLFQQTGLVGELSQEIRSALNDKGRYNFALGRRIVGQAIGQGLLKRVDVFGLIDAFWGLFIGIVQLEDIKSKDRGTNKFLKPTLQLAQKIVIDAIALNKGKKV